MNSKRRWWARWSTLGAIAALTLFLNGVPEFFDETLPWLSKRVRFGDVDATVWALVSGVAAIASAVTAIVAVVVQRRLGVILRDYTTTYGGDIVKRTTPKEAHTLAAVGGTLVTCSCGWRGEGPEFDGHRGTSK